VVRTIGKTKGANMARKTLTVNQAADRLLVEPQTIRRYCRNKLFKCKQEQVIGTSILGWKIDAESFRAWVKQGGQPKTGRPAKA
jgi:hypothetical protein